MKRNSLWRLLAIIFSLLLIAAACGDGDSDADGDANDDSSSEDTDTDTGDTDDGDGDGDSEEAGSADGVSLDYWLWDANQQPFYEQCAAEFGSASGITVNITQFGWGDYWDGLTSGFATGDVPDVFTNHLTRYPEFIDAGLLVPLNDFIEADGTPTDIYFPGLADLWIAPDGSRYGLPKDFDTIALVVNEDMLADAGLSADDLQDLEWNPSDGGSFEEVVAKLTVDANGNRGDSPDFDPSNVAVHGFTSQNVYADAFGQTGFSTFTGSNGWEFLNVNPWGDQYNYNEPEFAEVIEWFASMVEKGYMPDSETLAGSGSDTLFDAGTVAMMPDGSWKIGTWSTSENVNAVFVPTPVGPAGQRASMFNGLADSITAASDHPDEAWQWVQFLASPTCQEIVGSGGVVFPAIESGATLAEEAFLANGVDVSAFTVHVDEGTTFTFPIAGQAGEVTRIMGEAIDRVIRGEGDSSTLAEANEEINALLGS